jgi:hypothetical protein
MKADTKLSEKIQKKSHMPSREEALVSRSKGQQKAHKLITFF